MQAYATAEIAPATALRLLDDQLPISDRTTRRAAAGSVVLDELLAHLADLVAAKVIDRLARQETAATDEWLDTRDASQYLGPPRQPSAAGR
jgi:hypothetical protein